MTVLLILGNRMNDDSTISKILERRLLGALNIIHSFKIDKIICSGGLGLKSKTLITESSAMKEYLISHGIDESLIIEENESTTTKENMKYSKTIIENLHADSVILLSSNYHFERNFLNPIKLFKKELPDISLTIYGVD